MDKQALIEALRNYDKNFLMNEGGLPLQMLTGDDKGGMGSMMPLAAKSPMLALQAGKMAFIPQMASKLFK